MSKKIAKVNKNFMLINGLLAFGVFSIIFLFLDLSYRTPDAQPRYTEQYTIQMGESVVGDSVSIFINDSLLLQERITVQTQLRITRFDEESMLTVVNNATEAVQRLNLPVEKTQITIEKSVDAYQLTAK